MDIFSVFIRQNSTPCNFKTDESWVILSPIEQRIKAKIEAVGTPLKDWDINIYRGVLTGCNEAFIIDGATKKELIRQDPKSAEIIRPILRGRDIKRYGYEFADLWLINTHNGIKEKGLKPVNINKYPAVKKHLDKYYPELKKRQDKGDTPYNLRNCAYMEDFSKQKIVWARLMRISKNAPDDFPRFSLVDDKAYPLDSLCFFTGKNLSYLQAVLNSELAKYWFFNNIAILDNGGMQMRQQYVEAFPVPKVDKSLIKIAIEKSKLQDSSLDKYIYQFYGFSQEEISFIKQVVREKIIEVQG